MKKKIIKDFGTGFERKKIAQLLTFQWSLNQFKYLPPRNVHKASPEYLLGLALARLESLTFSVEPAQVGSARLFFNSVDFSLAQARI